jgi:hypothetical protein
MANDPRPQIPRPQRVNALGAFLTRLTGAPLDFIKAAAAISMVCDHFNTIILGREQIWLFRLGRIAFPLFCLAVAVHVIRRADSSRALLTLLVFAAFTQPVYAWAFSALAGNVLFTLAAGAALAIWLPTRSPSERHFALAISFAVCWMIPSVAPTGSDYGLLGMLFPATIVLAARDTAYLPWMIAYVLSLNAFPHGTGAGWWMEPAIDAVFAVVGGALVIALGTRLADIARFLPKYFLHIFYPGHLALLGLLAATSR